MDVELLWVFIFSLIVLLVLRQIAYPLGLVDRPNYRKYHQGAVPLVGGIAIFCGMAFALVCFPHPLAHKWLYLFCAFILMLTGALDDRFDLSVKIRALVQAVVALLMIYANVALFNLGAIFDSHQFLLGPFGYLFTLLAVWAAINAFNMIDGIDGLLGSVSCVAFLAIGVMLAGHGEHVLSYWCFVMVVIIVPYWLANLGLLGQSCKVFMGDAGSTLIGFTLIWILLSSTQNQPHWMKPVMALWFIAIPLMDMLAIMYRRMRKGLNPFHADRHHIHHILLKVGFSPRQTLLIITLLACGWALVGFIINEYLHWPESKMLALFLLSFLIYAYSMSYIDRKIERQHDNNQ